MPRQVEGSGTRRGLPNLFGHFQDRRRAGQPAPLGVKTAGLGRRPARAVDGYFLSSRRAGPPAPLGVKMRSPVSLRQPRTPELVQGPTSPTASTSRGVRCAPRTPELVRAFSKQAPRRPAGTPMDENRRARSETGPSSDERLFSKQAPRRPAGTPRDENSGARSETGPSGLWQLFSKQE